MKIDKGQSPGSLIMEASCWLVSFWKGMFCSSKQTVVGRKYCVTTLRQSLHIWLEIETIISDVNDLTSVMWGGKRISWSRDSKTFSWSRLEIYKKLNKFYNRILLIYPTTSLIINSLGCWSSFTTLIRIGFADCLSWHKFRSVSNLRFVVRYFVVIMLNQILNRSKTHYISVLTATT